MSYERDWIFEKSTDSNFELSHFTPIKLSLHVCIDAKYENIKASAIKMCTEEGLFHISSKMPFYVVAISYPKKVLKMIDGLKTRHPELKPIFRKAEHVVDKIESIFNKFSVSQLRHFLKERELAYLVKLFLKDGTDEFQKQTDEFDELIKVTGKQQVFNQNLNRSWDQLTLYTDEIWSISLLEDYFWNVQKS